MQQPLPTSLRRLARDHIDMRATLAALEREVQAVAEYHDADADLLGRGVQYFAAFPALCHHPVEEAIHEALKARAPAAAEMASGTGRYERLDASIGEFAMMTRNLLLDAPTWRIAFCAAGRAFIGLKREHIREEENVLFPLALEHLTARDWADIDLIAEEGYSAWSADPANTATAGVFELKSGRAAPAIGSARPL